MKYKRVGKKIAQVCIGSPVFNNGGNEARVILYKGLEKPSISLIIDTEPFKKVKEITKGTQPYAAEQKENIDIVSFTNFDLIGVHLDSTTDISTEPNGQSVKEKESEMLLDIVEEVYRNNNNPVIVAGDFNFPRLLDDITPMGFNNDIKHDPSSITQWLLLCEKLNIPNFTQGNLKKKRFYDKLGNDQLWEGKMDERQYNTDFIGYYPKNITDTLTMNEITTQDIETINSDTPKITLIHPNDKSLFPYINHSNDSITGKMNPILNGSWLSDHGLVYASLKLPKKINRSSNIAAIGDLGDSDLGSTNSVKMSLIGNPTKKISSDMASRIQKFDNLTNTGEKSSIKKNTKTLPSSKIAGLINMFNSTGGHKLRLNRSINRKRRSKHRKRRKNRKSKLRKKSYKRKSTRKN